MTIEECVYWLAAARINATALLGILDAIVSKNVGECLRIERVYLKSARLGQVDEPSSARSVRSSIFAERRRRFAFIAWVMRQARFAMLREVGQ